MASPLWAPRGAGAHSHFHLSNLPHLRHVTDLIKRPLINQTSHSEKGQKHMRRLKTKKAFAATTFILMVLGALLIYGQMRVHSVKAKSAHSQPNIPTAIHAAASSSATLAAAQSLFIRPTTPIYALNSNNVIFVLWPTANSFTRLVRVTQVNGNLIGIDFRPADGNNNALYALTDTGT